MKKEERIARIIENLKESHRRRGVFVDVQNIYHTTGRRRVNYEVLRDVLDNGNTTFVAFKSYNPKDPGDNKFVDALALIGYRVITKPIRELPDGTIKANMDMEMAMEILGQSPHLDEVVLVSGDGDFVPLINYLVQQGKYTVVIGPESYTARELIHLCHIFICLSDLPDIWLGPDASESPISPSA